MEKPTEVKKNLEIQTIIDLYKKYVANQTEENAVICSQFGLEEIERLGAENLVLTIDLPIENIIKIFEETGVIQLRKIDTSTKLLLGCGNTPCDPKMSSHTHEGFVTINPDLTMNPSVIAAFGTNSGLNKILPKNFYDALYGEAVSITDPEFTNFDKSVLNCMKPGFKTYELSDPTPYEFDQSNMVFNIELEHEQSDKKTQSDSVDSNAISLYSLIMFEGDQAAGDYIKQYPESLETLFNARTDLEPAEREEEVKACLRGLVEHAENTSDKPLSTIIDHFINEHDISLKERPRKNF